MALQSSFYHTLPTLPEFSKEESDFAFFLYDLVPDAQTATLSLKLQRVVYTKFESALEQIAKFDMADENLFELVEQPRGKFLLTYDDFPEIRVLEN